MTKIAAAPLSGSSSSQAQDRIEADYRAAREGDKAALNRLLVHYEPRLRRIVRIQMSQRVRLHYDSLDVLQNTYHVALRKIDGFEPTSKGAILQWLAAISLNQIRDMRARIDADKRNPDREVSLDAPDVAGHLPNVPGMPSPAAEAANQELKELIDRAVTELPAEHCDVMLKRSYMGLPWKEIAEQMGRSVKATRELHRRARIKLAARLGPEFDPA